MQLNLFTNITCDHCGKNPGFKPQNPFLWNGFFDHDTRQRVCYQCREKHYQKKAIEFNLIRGMIYSEMPVMNH